MSLFRVIPLSLIAVSLTACMSMTDIRESFRSAQAVPATEGGYARFVCGNVDVPTRFENDQLYLTIDGVEYALPAVIAASGARYAGEHDGKNVEFWNKGREASLTVGQREYPRCHQVDDGLPATYRAVGQEPSWLLLLEADAARLYLQHGSEELTAPRDRIRTGSDRWHVNMDGKRVSFSMEDGLCRDTMSGIPHPHRATLSVDDNTYQGCGGNPLDLVEWITWHVVSIDDEPLPAGVNIDMLFMDDGRMGGQSACNRYFGPFQLGEQGVNVGPLARTLKLCDPARMKVEETFVKRLESAFSHDFDEQGRLIIRDAQGGSIRARR